MRQANRDASTKKIARRHINVIHARNRFAEARRRRETASRAEFETFARRFPKIPLFVPWPRRRPRAYAEAERGIRDAERDQIVPLEELERAAPHQTWNAV